MIITTLLLIGLEIAERFVNERTMAMKVTMITLTVLVGLLQIASYFVAAAAISGMTAVIVTQEHDDNHWTP